MSSSLKNINYYLSKKRKEKRVIIGGESVLFCYFPLEGFWGIKAPRRVSFLFGRQHGGRFLLVKILGGKVGMGWIIFWIIAQRLINGGILYLDLLAISWVLLVSVKELLFGWRNWLGKHSLDIWNRWTFKDGIGGCLTIWRAQGTSF